jgi:uncharacterized protein YbbK (DUF523 family)
MKKTAILVSACLLGVCCRYDGESKPCADVISLRDRFILIPICPEQLGGLPTPRLPSELKNGKVINTAGNDVTEQYLRGAEEALRLAKIFHCPIALLKARSPSCGSGNIYDGSFTGSLISGDGFTAQRLKNAGIVVFTEEELDDLLSWISNLK